MEKIRSIKDLIISAPDKIPEKDIASYVASHAFDVTRVPEEADVLVYVDDCPVGSKESIIMITGLSKSRKTVAASALASSIFVGEFLKFRSAVPADANILHIDIEQGYRHYYYSVKRIFDQAEIDVPKRFTSLHTRDADIEFNLEVIEYLLEKLKPMVFILDGVTDLSRDINNQDEASELGRRILAWTTKYNLLFISVIHTTQSTGFMTGAIGTFLTKKAESVIKVSLDEQDKMVSHISCQFARNKAFSDFSIQADPEGNYSILNESDIISNKDDPNKFSIDQHKKMVHKILGLSRKIEPGKAESLVRNFSNEIFGQQVTKKMAAAAVQFYAAKAMIFPDADGGYSEMLPIELPSPQLQIDPSDELPF